MLYDKNTFTHTTADLAEAHGTSPNTISSYTQEGAFPFARREGTKTNLYYPASTLRMTMGEIKKNRDSGKHKEACFILDPLPQTKKRDTEVDPMIASRLLSIITSLDALDRKMTRIETKLHAVSEGRQLIGAEHYNDTNGNKPTIGDMLNNTKRSNQ